MRALLQRVTSASVMVDGARVGEIGQGLLCLVGIGEGDTSADAEYICSGILRARLFEADGVAWKGSLASLRLPVLVVSQFTLMATTRKPKPDFKAAMKSEPARDFYDAFIARMRREHGTELVQTGVFQAMMQVASVNDGPVTVMLESPPPKSVGGAARDAAASPDGVSMPD